MQLVHQEEVMLRQIAGYLRDLLKKYQQAGLGLDEVHQQQSGKEGLNEKNKNNQKKEQHPDDDEEEEL